MAKRGGFPGGGMPGNMANLMKQAQKMQRQMEEQAKEMETKEFSATAGGGAVEVTVSGSKKILKVKLDEEVVDPDDVEMLEDLLVAAVNEALEKVDAETTSAMSKFTGGMGGGMNMDMIQKAQKMQQDMLKMQEEMEQKAYEASAGGGVVTAQVNGKHEVVSLTIAPDAVDPEDVEMLQDLVIAAVNEALRKADSEASANMAKLTGGLNLGGLF